MPDDEDLSIPFEDPIPLEDGADGLGDDETIPLLDTEEQADNQTISLNEPLSGPSVVRAIRSSMDAGRKTEWKRPMNMTGKGATRCRLFHCKIADSSLENLENQINDWLDDEGIEVKHVGHVVGVLEGKHNEPNVVIVVWY